MEKEVSEARCGFCTCVASHLCHMHLGLRTMQESFNKNATVPLHLVSGAVMRRHDFHLQLHLRLFLTLLWNHPHSNDGSHLCLPRIRQPNINCTSDDF